jgi:hypothetical protein
LRKWQTPASTPAPHLVLTEGGAAGLSRGRLKRSACAPLLLGNTANTGIGEVLAGVGPPLRI